MVGTHTAIDCNRLQQTATDCITVSVETNMLSTQTASDWRRLQQTATNYTRLQQTTQDCNKLHQTATKCTRQHCLRCTAYCIWSVISWFSILNWWFSSLSLLICFYNFEKDTILLLHHGFLQNQKNICICVNTWYIHVYRFEKGKKPEQC